MPDDPIAQSRALMLEKLKALTGVNLQVQRVVVLLDGFARTLDAGHGWEELSQAYAAADDVPVLRWPDGELARPFVLGEMQAAAAIIQKLTTMASLAALMDEVG